MLIAGHELIVWRGYSDKIFVSGAYCPHLGAHIGTGGTVVGADCIRCPFHHWSFNGSTDGKVHHIPYTQGKGSYSCIFECLQYLLKY